LAQRQPDRAVEHPVERGVLGRGHARLGYQGGRYPGVPRPPTQRVHQAPGRDRPQPADRAAAGGGPGERGRRAPHREVGLLHHLGDEVVVVAAAAQPDGQPGRGPPVQLVERAAVTPGDPPDQLLLVHTQTDGAGT
jgi:hypothetical protein